MISCKNIASPPIILVSCSLSSLSGKICEMAGTDPVDPEKNIGLAGGDVAVL